MADKKISQLTELTSPSNGDFVAIVDASSTPSQTKKISYNNLAGNKAPKADPTFSGNVTLVNSTENPKKFTKQKTYGDNGVVELQRGTSTDDQLTLSWDGPASKNFSIVQHVTGAAQGQIKFRIADNGVDSQIRLDAKKVDLGSSNTTLTRVFSDTNLGAQKKFVFVDSRNENHGLQFKHTGPNSPTFQFGMAGAAFNSADFGQLKVRHTTSAGVTENVIVVDKDNGFTKLESDYTEVKNLKVANQGYTQFGSLTTTQRNALTAANGMVIYNTTDNKFQGYQNGAWVNLA